MFKPTIKNNRILRSQQVLPALISVVRPYLPLDLQNTRIRAEDIIAVLGYTSANRISREAACQELKGAPSANRLREVLAEALPERTTLQRALNRILRAQTPRFVKMKKRSCAVKQNPAPRIFTDTPQCPLCMTNNAMCWRCASSKKVKAWQRS